MNDDVTYLLIVGRCALNVVTCRAVIIIDGM